VFRRLWVLLVAAALVAAATTTAHAAQLTLTSETLFATKSSANALPAQLVYDTFATIGTATLNTRPAPINGQPWAVIRRTLQGATQQVQCFNCSASLGFAVIDADLPQVTATVQLRRIGALTPGLAGLVMNANATGTQAIVVLWNNGVVRLYTYGGGNTLTQLAQGNSVGISTLFDTPLVVTYSAGTYSVSFNGSLVLTWTLTVAQQTTYGSNTYFGVAFRNDADRIRLDNFEVKQ
jgi:hypothetical protein